MTAAAIARAAACLCFDDFSSVRTFLLITWAGVTNTSPAQLALLGKEYKFDDVTESQVKVYLLAKIAGLSGLTPKQLAAQAACLCFWPELQRSQAQVYLLTLIAGVTGLSPAQLAVAGKEYKFDSKVESQVHIYLYAKLAGLTALSPRQLAINAACFCFWPEDQLEQVRTLSFKTIAKV